MWRTSARGRTQFSVEKPNTVSQPMSRRHGHPDETGQVLLALGVAVGPGAAAPVRPAPVAVHDAGDVELASSDAPGRLPQQSSGDVQRAQSPR